MHRRVACPPTGLDVLGKSESGLRAQKERGDEVIAMMDAALTVFADWANEKGILGAICAASMTRI
jgi:hypothetical protein